MPHIKGKQKSGLRGTVTVRSYKAGTLAKAQPYADEARVLAQLIAKENDPRLISLFKQRRQLSLRRMKRILKSGQKGNPIVQKNTIVYSLNCGFDILVQYLLSFYNGSFAFNSTLGIAWGEIGTGTTAPLNTDTALTTPTNRATVSYAADISYNEAQLQFFFPDATLTNQTYYEFGTFIGGSSSIGTGNMFNHALFAVPYSKSAGTDTTVEVDFEFGQGSGFDQGGFS